MSAARRFSGDPSLYDRVAMETSSIVIRRYSTSFGLASRLLAHAVGHPQWAEVESLFGRADLTAAQGDRIRVVLEEIGSRRFAEALARDFANRAWEALAGDALPDAAREEFRPIVASVLGRVR